MLVLSAYAWTTKRDLSGMGTYLMAGLPPLSGFLAKLAMLAPLLGPGGEFAFIVIGLAMAGGIMTGEIGGLLLTVVALASVGLPGTNGFVGEFLVLLGSFGNFPAATIIAPVRPARPAQSPSTFSAVQQYFRRL